MASPPTTRPRLRLAALLPSVRVTPLSVFVAATVLTVAMIAVLFPGIAPHDPTLIDGQATLQGPSWAHLLGTDDLGRDVFSRVIAGTRTGLIGPLILAVGNTVLATALALAAGYLGGRVDAVVGRLLDLLYSVPASIVAIVVVGVTAGGWWTAIGVLLIFGLPGSVRLLRATVITRARLPYVEAARTGGASGARIMARHLLPAIAPFVVAVFFLSFTYAIVDLSSLSFLGLGVPPGSPDWGRMIAENRAYLFQNAWASVGAVLVLVMVAVSANLIGDFVYSRYEDRGRSR